MDAPSTLDVLVKQLAALPGFGRRSARRAALHLLVEREKSLKPLINSLERVQETIVECSICGNLDEVSPCQICGDTKRLENKTLCVVENVSDIWAIERTKSFKGVYHILGGVLSPLEGVSPEDLRITLLLERIQSSRFEEVILAMSATVDGQTTAHYLIDEIERLDPQITLTRLAHGVPIGGELDYLDEGTISTALRSRAQV